MKVIDLLNKIANGEEVPEKINFKGCIYYLCKNDQSGQCYFTEKEGFGGLSLKLHTGEMNDEVEIIEEDKKIEKLVFNKDQDGDILVNGVSLVEKERLNNIINSIDTRLIEMGVDDKMLEVCEMYDVNGIELRKMIKKLKGVDKE